MVTVTCCFTVLVIVPESHDVDVAFAFAAAVTYTVGVMVTYTGALHSSPAGLVGLLAAAVVAREREGRAASGELGFADADAEGDEYVALPLEGPALYCWDAAAGVGDATLP
jgi:hypothetical protein